jgi:hypothetical protein
MNRRMGRNAIEVAQLENAEPQQYPDDIFHLLDLPA